MILPYLLRPRFRRKPLLRVRPLAYQASACNSIGGAGDDVVIINGGGVGPAGPPGPAGPAGPQGPQGIPGEVSPVAVTDVTTTPYAVLITDLMLAVDVATPASIVLPVSVTGSVFIVKDIDGDAAINPITITASTTIDGAASALINANYGSLTFIFNGTEWNIV